MKNETVTNYIVKCSAVNYVERYILPEFRDEMNALIEKMEDMECEPILVIGRDGKWWNDSLDFPLDRMSDGNYAGVLSDWVASIERNPLKLGEKRSIKYMGDIYSVEANTKDLRGQGLMSNDCEPILD